MEKNFQKSFYKFDEIKFSAKGTKEIQEAEFKIESNFDSRLVYNCKCTQKKITPVQTPEEKIQNIPATPKYFNYIRTNFNPAYKNYIEGLITNTKGNFELNLEKRNIPIIDIYNVDYYYQDFREAFYQKTGNELGEVLSFEINLDFFLKHGLASDKSSFLRRTIINQVANFFQYAWKGIDKIEDTFVPKTFVSYSNVADIGVMNPFKRERNLEENLTGVTLLFMHLTERNTWVKDFSFKLYDKESQTCSRLEAKTQMRGRLTRVEFVFYPGSFFREENKLRMEIFNPMIVALVDYLRKNTGSLYTNNSDFRTFLAFLKNGIDLKKWY